MMGEVSGAENRDAIEYRRNLCLAPSHVPIPQLQMLAVWHTFRARMREDASRIISTPANPFFSG
jgi:hypothetical protein